MDSDRGHGVQTRTLGGEMRSGAVVRLIVVGMALATLAGCTGASPSPSLTNPPTPAPTVSSKPTHTATPQPTIAPTRAPRFSPPAEGKYVYDYADVIQAAEASQVNSAAAAFAKKYSCNVWFVTEIVDHVSQVSTENAANYATQILREWSSRCDVVFVYLTAGRENYYSWDCETAGMPVPNEGFWTEMRTGLLPSFDKGHFVTAFNGVMSRFGKLLAAAAP
jgi:hypothetical protein